MLQNISSGCFWKFLGFQPATLSKRRLRQRCFSVNFAKCLRTSFLLTEHLRMTASCVYVWILRNFSENFFYRAPPRNCYFMYKLQIWTTKYSKKLFHRWFSIFYTRSRSSHSKAFIYLKSLKTVCEEVNPQWSCEMPTCNFRKKLFHPSTFRSSRPEVFCKKCLLRNFAKYITGKDLCQSLFFNKVAGLR